MTLSAIVASDQTTIVDDGAEIGDRIAAILRDELKLNVPSAETDLLAAGLIDSLSLVNLIFHLEEAFSVTTTVDDLEPDNFATIASMTRFVRSRRAAGSAR